MDHIYFTLLMISLHTRIDIKILVFLWNIYDLDCLLRIKYTYIIIRFILKQDVKKKNSR